MISLRYHVLSMGAVFLALAIGVLLGSSALSDRLLSGLSEDNDDLGKQVVDLKDDRSALQAQLDNADGFVGAIAPKAVAGALQGRSVVLVTTSDAEVSDRDAVASLLGAAGATVTGEIQLTEAFTDPNRSDQLTELSTRLLPAGVQLPTAADAGTVAGGLLGALLQLDPAGNAAQASPGESAAVLAGLRDGGFLAPGPVVPPAQLALVITGSASEDVGEAATILARFTTQLDRSGAGVVLAGRPGADEGTGPVAAVRADPGSASVVSTVDNVDRASGRITTVLALAEQAAGRSGRYGTGAGTETVIPPLAG